MSSLRASQAFARLVETIALLRSPEGCPWDAEQTPESLLPYLVEETYEALDAIEAGDPQAIRDELGDLLLQIVFQARIFEERGQFDMAAVSEAITEKMIRRHPHVFAGQKDRDPQTLAAQWERIKADEKSQKKESVSILDSIPRNLPALRRARKVSEKVGRVGFDWPDVGGILDKVREEMDELDQALKANDRAGVEAELGDLLFTLVNLGRYFVIDAEDALRRTIDRFQRRFWHIEESLRNQGRILQETSMEELENLWQEAKAIEHVRLPSDE